MQIDKSTNMSAVKIAYELGKAVREGRMAPEDARSAVSAAAIDEDGAISFRELEDTIDRYERQAHEAQSSGDSARASACLDSQIRLLNLQIFVCDAVVRGEGDRLLGPTYTGASSVFTDEYVKGLHGN